MEEERAELKTSPAPYIDSDSESIHKDSQIIDSKLILNELDNLNNQFDEMPASESKPTIFDLLAAAEIDLSKPLPPPPVCLFIGDASVYYLGDISTTIGKAKGRKTFASGLFLAALAGNCTIQNNCKLYWLQVDENQLNLFGKGVERC